MQTIYLVKVSIPAAPLMLERNFFFATSENQELFIKGAVRLGYTVTARGIDYLLQHDEALAECAREAASVDAPAA
jgi:hypothetical protein